MAWIFLILAGVLETGWAATLKASADRPGIALLGATAVLLTASMGFLMLAFRGIPLGIAYPIWTGIGSVGSVLLGVLIFGDALPVRVLAGVALIVLGIVLIGSGGH